jgi:hypothetical protein
MRVKKKNRRSNDGKKEPLHDDFDYFISTWTRRKIQEKGKGIYCRDEQCVSSNRASARFFLLETMIEGDVRISFLEILVVQEGLTGRRQYIDMHILKAW